MRSESVVLPSSNSPSPSSMAALKLSHLIALVVSLAVVSTGGLVGELLARVVRICLETWSIACDFSATAPNAHAASIGSFGWVAAFLFSVGWASHLSIKIGMAGATKVSYVTDPSNWPLACMALIGRMLNGTVLVLGISLLTANQ